MAFVDGVLDREEYHPANITVQLELIDLADQPFQLGPLLEPHVAPARC